MFCKIFITITIAILISTTLTLAQTEDQQHIKRPEGSEIRFVLDKDDQTKDVGLASNKTYWKLKYELWLVDLDKFISLQERLTSKYGNTQNGRGNAATTRKVAKKLHSRIKKLDGILVNKGSVRKYGLHDLANREIRIPFKYTNQVKQVLDQAVNSKTNPTFVIRFRTSFKLRSISGITKKKRVNSQFIYPFKILINGKYVAVDAPQYGASIKFRHIGNTIALDLFRL